MNYLWLFVVAGGAAILGAALAFGTIRQDPKRSIPAIAGAFIVAIVAVLIGVYVSSASTAPPVPPDRQETEKQLPAAPGQTSDLPGK